MNQGSELRKALGTFKDMSNEDVLEVEYSCATQRLYGMMAQASLELTERGYEHTAKS